MHPAQDACTLALAGFVLGQSWFVAKQSLLIGLVSIGIRFQYLRCPISHASGFTWVISDGEHSQLFGRMGRVQNAMMSRVGITPVQRLHREAVSEHGDALALGVGGRSRYFPMPYCPYFLNSRLHALTSGPCYHAAIRHLHCGGAAILSCGYVPHARYQL